MSVALNLGCILVDKDPIKRLFDAASITNKKNIPTYIDEYSKKLSDCTKAVALVTENKSKAYLKLNKLISSYLKIERSLKFLKEYSEEVSPICFSYACLLLSFYGLLSLLLIPIATAMNKGGIVADRAMDVLVLFSLFTGLWLIVFFIVEIVNRYGNKRLNKLHSTKYLVIFTCIVSVYLLIVSIVSCYNCLNLKFIYPYVYDMSIILPFLSFVVCFLLYLHDLFLRIPVQYYKNKFNKIYNELNFNKD